MAPSLSGKVFPVINPATGEQVAEAAFGEAADVDAAVQGAYAAQKAWKKVSARDRGKLVVKCGQILAEHAEELARLIALETGKALRTESRVEASVLADAFTFFGGLGSELKGETVPFSPTIMTMTVREPIGIVGAILPWNVPLLLMALKIAPALVAGNAVIVKSAEEAPLTVLRVVHLMNTVMPAGLVNILSGFGPEMRRSAGFAPQGRQGDLHRVGPNRQDRLQGGGGKADPGHAGAWRQEPHDRHGGRRSGPRRGRSHRRHALHPPGPELHGVASRIFVHDSLHDAFVERLKAKVDADEDGRSAGRDDRYRDHRFAAAA